MTTPQQLYDQSRDEALRWLATPGSHNAQDLLAKQNEIYQQKLAAAGLAISPIVPPEPTVMDTVTAHLPFILTFLSITLVGIIIGLVMIQIAKNLRIVVGTNDVHIVQRGRSTIAYGTNLASGNVYYRWPSWFPGVGVQVTILPVSVYALELKDYPGYDKGRVPFIIDIIGFFRVDDPTVAAARITSFNDLKAQMTGVLQGAIRSILATSDIEEILEGRSRFSEMFTHAVDDQLKSWGIVSVKAIEFMDIRDAKESQIIYNIMSKKKSVIEMESRTVVAGNQQRAAIAEVEAKRQVGLAEQEAQEQVGKRQALKDLAVGVAKQEAEQAIQESSAMTMTKQMAVSQIEHVRSAEITRDVAVVKADQERQVLIVNTEADKQRMIITAEGTKANLTLVGEGTLASAKLSAEGVEAQGRAKGAADTAVLMAPVNAQIALAEKIDGSENYQKYLIEIRSIESQQAVGIEQARAIARAEIKIVANSGTIPGGAKSVMELLTPSGGLQIGAALEALSQTEAGKAIVERLKGEKG